jgi:Polysaccharide lyase family 4, domain II
MRIFGLALLLSAAATKHGPPADQRMLKLIDRETQIANLLTAGKLAFDAGEFPTAVAKWEALLKIDGVPADVEAAVKPLLAQARKDAVGLPGVTVDQPVVKEEAPRPVNVTVTGTVAGGGTIGPGGAVITLKGEGFLPKVPPVTRSYIQKDKRFSPHVMAVPVGSTVNFRNEDDLFHNVFSLSPVASFDTGLHKAGVDTPQKFDKPGVVELLCNIHATMLGYIVVVDTPYYAVADGSGAFTIKNVPPGNYEATVWHESASAVTRRKITVGDGGALSFNIAADKRPNPFPPDKYGKPRQQQLGY